MSERTCTVEDCAKPRGTYAQGWCPMHWQRWRRHGSLDKPPKRQSPPPGPCVVDGCANAAHAKGLCATHYKAAWHQENRERQYEATKARRNVDRAAYLAESRAYYRANRARILAQMAAKYAEDPESGKRAAREWREANLSRVRENKRAHYLDNRERLAPQYAAYYAANRETRLESNHKWREANRARDCELTRRWRAANPARRRESEMRRHAVKRGAKVTKSDYAAILAEHGMVCHICGDAIPSMADLHFDHVIPLARGGAHAAFNIRPSHALCNMRKGARVA